MTAYYNEIDKYAAQWLRNLIAAGHIAPGVVDERSIEDVHPDDLGGFTQCHFFAGIGVWSLALRRAGWPDDRPVWTGSCPCQPFSEAGPGAGFADERHLWPHFHWLIQERRPAIVFGEQVASKAADPWVDLVCADMEAVDYAFGAVPFASAGAGAPHIRERIYWVAYSNSGIPGQRRSAGGAGCERLQRRPVADGCRMPGWLADAEQLDHRCEAAPAHHREPKADRPTNQHRGHSSAPVRMANPIGERWPGHTGPDGGLHQGAHGSERLGVPTGGSTGPANSFWRDADWLRCRDGRWRPVEPGTFPLAHGAPARVGRLRAYGNAINAEAARIFIEAVMDCMP